MIATVKTWADGNVTLSVSAPSSVETGGKFRVQFKVNTQNVSGFTAPDFRGFQVLYGPSTSSSSSFQIVNGHTSQSSSITYTFVLVAETPGTYTIGSASVQVDGKVVKSRAVQIKVLPSGSDTPPQGGTSSTQNAHSQQTAPSGSMSRGGQGVDAKDLFMTATASRTTVHEQEAILLTYKIYTLVDLTQLEGKLPTLDGFQIQEIQLPRNKEFTLEQYKGQNYRTVVWSQYVLFPQKSGKLTIPAITYEGVVMMRNRNIDPFEAFFNGTGAYTEVKRKITTPAITLNVQPLPTKPAGFSGGVGTFTATSSISANEVSANDAVTLKLTVKGSGNMKLISTPEIPFPKGFETYDAQVNDNFQLTRDGLSGTKEFEYLFVPRHAGTYQIPAIKFIYFDTNTRTYKSIATESYMLKVKKAKGGSGQTVTDYSGLQQDVQQLGQDIRFIKQGEVTFHQPEDKFFGTWRYYVAYVVPLLLFAIALLLGLERMKANANVALSRGRKANKVALRRLKKAKRLLAAHDQSRFYDEVLRALWGYAGDKCNMSQETLNKENIAQALASRQVSEERIQQFIRVLGDCEFARYAPGDANQNMEHVYASALDAITQMES